MHAGLHSWEGPPQFCPDCVQHGIFVDARRVRAITESMHGEFANRPRAGLWTTIRTQDQVDQPYRLVNQTHLCKGPRLVVFEAEPPHSVAWAPWATAEFVVDGFVHLRLGLGTLVPTKTAAPQTTAPALPAPVQMLPAPPPTFDALLAAHDHLGHLASASMLQPDLSDQQGSPAPPPDTCRRLSRRASLAALAPSGLVAAAAHRRWRRRRRQLSRAPTTRRRRCSRRDSAPIPRRRHRRRPVAQDSGTATTGGSRANPSTAPRCIIMPFGMRR